MTVEIPIIGDAVSFWTEVMRRVISEQFISGITLEVKRIQEKSDGSAVVILGPSS